MKNKYDFTKVMFAFYFAMQVNMILNKIVPPKYETMSWWLVLSPILIVASAAIVTLFVFIILLWKSNKTYNKIKDQND